MTVVQPLVFDVELNTVCGCLGNVKDANCDTVTWSSAISNRSNMNIGAGAGFEQTLTGLTLGVGSRSSCEESGTIQVGVVWTF